MQKPEIFVDSDLDASSIQVLHGRIELEAHGGIISMTPAKAEELINLLTELRSLALEAVPA